MWGEEEWEDDRQMCSPLYVVFNVELAPSCAHVLGYYAPALRSKMTRHQVR